MIQRIQSVYLFFAAALIAVMFFMPLASFPGGVQNARLTAFGLQAMEPGGVIGPWLINGAYLGILLAVCGVVPLFTLFLYKARKVQRSLCYLEMVLLVLAQGLVVLYIWQSQQLAAETLRATMAAYSVVDVLPLVSLIFTWLALRGINHDEVLVRSLDRIR